MTGQTIFHGIHWKVKHISVLTGISPARQHMTPFFMCSQVNHALERRRKTEASKMDVD
jgi:hypothetical protein